MLMIFVNIFLYVQIKAKNKSLGQEQDYFVKEKRTLFLIIMLFAMSYLIRSIWDINFLTLKSWDNKFAYYMLEDSVFLVSDGFTFLALLILHRKSFL